MQSATCLAGSAPRDRRRFRHAPAAVPCPRGPRPPPLPCPCSYAKPGVFRSSGVNFALPSDLILEVVPQLIVYHSAQARR